MELKPSIGIRFTEKTGKNERSKNSWTRTMTITQRFNFNIFSTMETKKSLKYLKAKKKVEVLKGLYGHISVYVILNTIMILFNANVFSNGLVDFSGLGNYFTAFIWGTGLFFHILYVLVYFNFNSNVIKRWEDKKIKEILDKE